MVHVKYYGFMILAIVLILLLIHQVMFINIGLAHYFMEGDEDLNRAVGRFLWASPFLLGFGGWTAHRTLRTIMGFGPYHQIVPWGLSFYSGLLGVVTCNFALVYSISWFEHFITTLSFFIGAFFLFAIPTYFASLRFFRRYQ